MHSRTRGHLHRLLPSSLVPPKASSPPYILVYSEFAKRRVYVISIAPSTQISPMSKIYFLCIIGVQWSLYGKQFKIQLEFLNKYLTSQKKRIKTPNFMSFYWEHALERYHRIKNTAKSFWFEISEGCGGVSVNDFCRDMRVYKRLSLKLF